MDGVWVPHTTGATLPQRHVEVDAVKFLAQPAPLIAIPSTCSPHHLLPNWTIRRGIVLWGTEESVGRATSLDTSARRVTGYSAPCSHRAGQEATCNLLDIHERNVPDASQESISSMVSDLKATTL